MANLYDKDRGAFWRRVLVLGVWAMVFPIVALFFTPFSFTVVIGFWVTGFVLLSWLYALFTDILLPAIRKKQVRNKIGMIVLHIGLAAMAVGIIGVETMTDPYDRFIAPDETSALKGYSFTLTKRDSTIAQDGDVIFVEEMRLMKPSGRSVSIAAFDRAPVEIWFAACRSGDPGGILPGCSGGPQGYPPFPGRCGGIPYHLLPADELDMGWRSAHVVWRVSLIVFK